MASANGISAWPGPEADEATALVQWRRHPVPRRLKGAGWCCRWCRWHVHRGHKRLHEETDMGAGVCGYGQEGVGLGVAD